MPATQTPSKGTAMRSSTAVFATIAVVTCAGTAVAQQAPTTVVTTPQQTTVVTTTPSGGTTVTTPGTPVALPPGATDAQPPGPPTPDPSTAAPMTSGSLRTPDLPPPEGPTTQSPINRPLLLTGTLFLGGTYLASGVDALTSGRQADRNNLGIPVAGPWMDYANRGCSTPGQCNSNETGYKALLILDGIGQGLGALAMVTSLFLPEKTTRSWYLIGNDSVHAAPAAVGTGYGLGAVGSF
jgi:hypothetical protein